MTVCATLALHLASAQTAELQQLVLDIEKLSQLKSILSEMKQGYAIIHGGYSTIKNLSEGNFNLHNGYLSSLLAINPALQKYQRVADIISNQALIVSEYKSAFTRYKNGGRFTSSELDYISSVYANLLKESLDNLSELTDVLTASKLRMSDAERIRTIDKLDADTQDKLSFLRSFNRRTSALDAQRAQALQDNRDTRQLYGMP